MNTSGHPPEIHEQFTAALRHYRAGRLTDAGQLCRSICEVNPHDTNSLHLLGLITHQLARGDDPAHFIRDALILDTGFAEAHTGLGYAVRDKPKLLDAVTFFERTLAAAPHFWEACHSLGDALKARGRFHDAVIQYKRAIHITPDSAVTHFALALTLKEQRNAEEAVEHFAQAAMLKPHFVEARCHLANALEQLGRIDEALTQYQTALAVDPTISIAHASIGNALQVLGEVDRAILSFQRAVAIAPKTGIFFLRLALAKRFSGTEPHFIAMKALSRNMSSLSVKDQTHFHFALGKVFADVGDHQTAFRHISQGNALKRYQTQYDESDVLKRFERVRAVFSNQLMTSKQGLGAPSRIPIFIIGMPRSGTTLVEQILASHPEVFGAGELLEMETLAGKLERSNRNPFPEAMLTMSGEQLRELGESYLRAIGSMAPAAKRVTDKMPGNFTYAGLIHLALPRARIIHIRREPRDTALSCFSMLFETGQEFTYDLAELGRYYRAYQRLMNHWRRVLPKGVMLEVQYESLVANLRQQSQRIIAHCGLNWDDACLAFYETRRPVRTASAAQVRQAIYRTSVNRWVPYKEFLDPFVRALRN